MREMKEKYSTPAWMSWNFPPSPKACMNQAAKGSAMSPITIPRLRLLSHQWGASAGMSAMSRSTARKGSAAQKESCAAMAAGVMSMRGDSRRSGARPKGQTGDWAAGPAGFG